MKELIIHVGTPRTGTTTLQKNAFNKLVRYEVYSKMPFTAKGLLTDEKGKSKFTIKWMQSFIQSIKDDLVNEGGIMDYRDEAIELVEDGNVDPMMMLIACLKWMSQDEVRDMLKANELLRKEEA